MHIVHIPQLAAVTCNYCGKGGIGKIVDTEEMMHVVKLLIGYCKYCGYHG